MRRTTGPRQLALAFADSPSGGGPLPSLDVSPDPWDNYLLALAQEGRADYLVTGDKSDLLSLGRHRETPIVTVRQMLEKLGGSGS